MNDEILNELASKIIGHYPDKSSISICGHVGQEPFKSDLLKIFKKAFNSRKLTNNSHFMYWGNFDEELLERIESLNSKVHKEIVKDIKDNYDKNIFNSISQMWSEWYYVLEATGTDMINEINYL